MRPTLFFALFALLSGIAIAQNRNAIDEAIDALAKRSEELDHAEKFDEEMRVVQKAIRELSNKEGITPYQRGRLQTELASAYLSKGDYGPAKKAIDDAFPLIVEGAGEISEQHARILRTRGILHKRMRDFNASERDLRRSYQIYAQTTGEYSLHTLAGRERWCGTLTKIDEARAIRAYEMLIPQLLEHVGDGGEYLVASLNLSVIFDDIKGREKDAIKLLETVLRIRRADTRSKTYDLILTINNLTRIHRRIREFKKSNDYAVQLLELEEHFGALQPEHQQAVYSNLYKKFMIDNDRPNAKKYANLYAKVHHGLTRDLLSFAPTSERISHALGPTSFHGLASTGAHRSLADALLQHKGIVLDTIVREKRLAHASEDPRLPPLMAELNKLQTGYRNSEFAGASSGDLAELGEEIARVQQELSRAVGVRDFLGGMDANAEKVSAALPEDAALVEFMMYDHYFPKQERAAWNYAAIVYQPNTPPRWVRLGPKKNLQDWMHSMEMRIRHGSHAEIEDRCRRIYDYVWSHCEKKLSPKVKTVYISTSGLTHFVSFAALVRHNGTFLGERYQFRYLTSGRDLLRPAAPPRPEADWVIVGNPQFGAKPNDDPSAVAANRKAPPALITAARSAEVEEWFQPLPGAEAEARALHAMAGDWGWKSQLLVGPQATEEALRDLQQPRILHLASHGFWLFRGEKITPALGIFVNPMYRGGIALADADRTFLTWRQGTMRPPSSDGALLADEAAELDLLDTWLVTLSACDTGIGYGRGNEGKFGLQRAFLQAGAQNVLSALWPIPDVESAEFMKEFYTALHETEDPALALGQVQGKRLMELRKSHGIGHAVKSVGGFTLYSAVAAKD